MKHVLIPTDFSIRSLHIIHDIVAQNEGQKLTVFILHMVQIPTDFSELIFFKKSYLYNKVPVAFTEAIQMLRNRYGSLLKAELRFSYGNHVKALHMAIESFNVGEIYFSAKHRYSLPFTNSVDIIPMLPKCDVPVYQVDTKPVYGVAEEPNMLSSLFSDDAAFTKINHQSAL